MCVCLARSWAMRASPAPSWPQGRPGASWPGAPTPPCSAHRNRLTPGHPSCHCPLLSQGALCQRVLSDNDKWHIQKSSQCHKGQCLDKQSPVRVGSPLPFQLWPLIPNMEEAPDLACLPSKLPRERALMPKDDSRRGQCLLIGEHRVTPKGSEAIVTQFFHLFLFWGGAPKQCSGGWGTVMVKLSH